MTSIASYEEKYVSNVYETIAPYFDNTRQYKWSWIQTYLDSLALNNKVLDLCCGNGRNMENCKQNMVGVDNCQNFVDICTAKGLDVSKQDMCELNFNDKSFDNIICIASFHHLYTNERRLKALHEMRRILEDDGSILISVWAKEQPKKTRRVFDNYGDTIVKWNEKGAIYERFYYIFRIDEVRNLFESAGFKIIEHKYDCGNEVFVLMKK
jgi:ubiquinone/menaquinone biosynthesis C-methylase UbiE